MLRPPSCPAPYALGLLVWFCAAAPSFGQVPAGYTGKAWHDTVQVIPGRIQPESYDEGASGVTWSDNSANNNGTYKVRATAVDLDDVKKDDYTYPTSTIKAVGGGLAVGGGIYWGWLVNNEWLKMTVDVKEEGTYAIHAMVGTNSENTSFKVDALNGTDSVSSGTMVLPFLGTAPGACPNGKECYHCWNYAKNVGQIKLKAGKQVIRMQIVKDGYNLEYIDLEKMGSAGIRGTESEASRGAGSVRKAGVVKGYDAAGRKPGRSHLPVRIFNR